MALRANGMESAPVVMRRLDGVVDKPAVSSPLNPSLGPKGIDYVTWDGKLLAILVPATFRSPGATFVTADESSLQVGYMNRPAGYQSARHRHVPVDRHIAMTMECLLIREGRCRVDLYADGNTVVATRELTSGDAAVIVSGGHSVSMAEETHLIEVKVGPFMHGTDTILLQDL